MQALISTPVKDPEPHFDFYNEPHLKFESIDLKNKCELFMEIINDTFLNVAMDKPGLLDIPVEGVYQKQ